MCLDSFYVVTFELQPCSRSNEYSKTLSFPLITPLLVQEIWNEKSTYKQAISACERALCQLTVCFECRVR